MTKLNKLMVFKVSMDRGQYIQSLLTDISSKDLFSRRSNAKSVANFITISLVKFSTFDPNMLGSTWQTMISGTVIVIMTLQLSLDSTANSSDVASCSEAVCARVVTKCLLTERCKCNFASLNYSCHKDCFNCLAELCYDCCSCFGICPKTTSNPLNKISSIEELDEPIPRLFDIYTIEGGDDQVPPRYNIFTFEQRKLLEEPSSKQQHVTRRNCTVAYTTNCMTNDDCKTMCINMGSSYSRWFHDGCCECVGNSCFDYGLGESRCANCPPTIERNIDKDDFYYMEDEDDEFLHYDDNHKIWTTNLTHIDEKLKYFS